MKSQNYGILIIESLRSWWKRLYQYPTRHPGVSDGINGQQIKEASESFLLWVFFTYYTELTALDLRNLLMRGKLKPEQDGGDMF